jgi:hypothetical protein
MQDVDVTTAGDHHHASSAAAWADNFAAGIASDNIT